MAYVEFEFRAGLRNRKGQVGAEYNKLPILYEKLAREVQAEAASIIRTESRKRLKNPRKGPRGTLARATLNQGNRLISKNGFDVGRQSYLARSEAKYYRIIEEGSATAAPRYTGTMISGGWRGNAPAGGQYFIPARADRRVTGLDRRPIQPLFAYRRAWNQVGVESRLRKAWRDVLVGQGIAGTRGPLPKTYRLPVTFSQAGRTRY